METTMQLFQVAGMTCGHCVRAVTEAVQQIDPAAAVQVDLSAGTARIDSTAATGTLADAIRDAGYDVRISTPS